MIVEFQDHAEQIIEEEELQKKCENFIKFQLDLDGLTHQTKNEILGE